MAVNPAVIGIPVERCHRRLCTTNPKKSSRFATNVRQDTDKRLDFPDPSTESFPSKMNTATDDGPRSLMASARIATPVTLRRNKGFNADAGRRCTQSTQMVRCG